MLEPETSGIGYFVVLTHLAYTLLLGALDSFQQGLGQNS